MTNLNIIWTAVKEFFDLTWKTVAAIVAFIKMLEFLNLPIPMKWRFPLAIAVFGIVFYWYAIKKSISLIERVKKFFIGLRNDIKFIKKKLKGRR